ncbi:hypothetical protein [uncultured Oscillibacter sp.]|uniref:hypothetical protein n=1 Tax=uncultured Oscillibacter sp. TaxID=876091 RepID=UPI0025FC5AAE|nr:hypothetical protein [uncultured Oscillibacter sp.]
MTKSEIQAFIEEMETIGDVWTEEQVERCYGNLPLHQALETRKTEVNQYLTTLGRAAIYLVSEEPDEGC